RLYGVTGARKHQAAAVVLGYPANPLPQLGAAELMEFNSQCREQLEFWSAPIQRRLVAESGKHTPPPDKILRPGISDQGVKATPGVVELGFQGLGDGPDAAGAT